jgi:hypothetical protein
MSKELELAVVMMNLNMIDLFVCFVDALGDSE